MHENITCDDILYGRLKLLQPKDGPRVNLDTILLSAWVKVRAGKSRFVELGCASGAISLLLAMKYNRNNFHVTGLEIQSDLVELAKINAKNNGIENINFIQGDLRDKNIFRPEYFDGLVVNPPYGSQLHGRISGNISRSFARHEVTCTPEDVAKTAARILKSKGRLFAVFTCERLDVFINAMTKYNLMPKRIRFIYPDMNHNSGIFLIECIKNGGEGVNILPPLIVRDDNNNYTPEILGAYDLEGKI